MCGICGVWVTGAEMTASKLAAIAERMANTLAHRGPNDQGIWVDPTAGIALGHRRLSVIDLSPLGHQPMVSSAGRYVISYNGEIYNFRELRHELEARGLPVRR